jgi:hypothetical protein
MDMKGTLEMASCHPCVLWSRPLSGLWADGGCLSPGRGQGGGLCDLDYIDVCSWCLFLGKGRSGRQEGADGEFCSSII